MAAVWLVVTSGSRTEQNVRVDERVHIGRECAGIDPSRRVLLDDPGVSRDHAEVQVISGAPFVVDHSTNGTRVNGRRIERGERVPLVDGDRLTIGGTEILLRATEVVLQPDESQMTITAESVDACVLLVGDVIGYTRLTEVHGAAAVAAAVDGLFTELRRLVVGHLGTVSNFAGDAILALWEESTGPRVATSAVHCAVELHRYATEAATQAPLRDESGQPIRFGWAVTAGNVATSHPSPARVSVHGDAVNLAFRLAGLAGRGAVAPILVQAAVAERVPDADFGPEFAVQVKGRQSAAVVRPVEAPATHS